MLSHTGRMVSSFYGSAKGSCTMARLVDEYLRRRMAVHPPHGFTCHCKRCHKWIKVTPTVLPARAIYRLLIS